MKTKPPKRKGRKIWIGFVVLAVFFVAEETWRSSYPSTQVNGERLTDFALPPVPDGENFFKAPFLENVAYGHEPKSAPSLNNAWAAGFIAGDWNNIDLGAVQKELLTGTNFTLTRGASATEAVVEALGQTPEAQELREAAKRKYSQCNPVLDLLNDKQDLKITPLRQLLQMFAVSATAGLSLGNADAAEEDTRVIEQLSCGLRGNSTVGSAFIRGTGSMCVRQVFWEGWKEGKWSGGQLAEFENYFVSLNLVADVERAFHADPLMSEYAYRGGESANLKEDLVRRVESVWLRVCLQNYRSMMSEDCYPCADAANGIIFPDLCKKGMADVNQKTNSYLPFRSDPAREMPNFERVFRTIAKNQSLVNEAAIVCALERFKHAQGHYPTALDELVPRYISSLPKDPIDGNALHYRLEKGDFVLYSIGWNEKDEGGAPGTNDETGDWVWGK